MTDVREQFARRSGDRDPAAEQAFRDSKLELVRTDPTLSEEERAAAIAEIEAKLGKAGDERAS